MDPFIEAGIFAQVAFLPFLAGLVLIVRRPPAALRNGVAIAAVVIGLCMVGQGAGQTMVDRAVEGEQDLATKIALLSMGAREASANQVSAA